MKQAEKKVVLITGASSGFGMGAALALASEGYHVVATMRNVEGKATLERAALSAGVSEKIDYLRVDVTQQETIQEAVSWVEKQYGRIDVLLNNAGYALGGAAEEVSLPDWQNQFATNFFGLVAMTQAVLPLMRSQQSGKIINIGSISGRIGFPGYSPYAASKFAVEGFSESLRLELLPFGIHVVLIEPGAYKTSIWQKGFSTIQVKSGSAYEGMMQAILKYSRHTAETAANPDEVVDVIVKAVKSPYPRLRYPIGKGSRLTIIGKSLLPWKWLERIVRRALG